MIGRELIKKLLRNGYTVTSFDLAEQHKQQEAFLNEAATLGEFSYFSGSILDKTAVRAGISGSSVVFHLAAMLGVRRTEYNRLVCIEVNVTGTDNILDACLTDRVDKIIFASSSEVYGEPNSNPVKENDELKGKSVYAITKMLGEEMARGYHELYPKLDYTVVRFFNTYGEGQIAQFVLSKFVKNVMEGKNPVVYGDGMQMRSYAHIDDVTDGLMKVLENPISSKKTYNLGNSTQVSTLKDLGQKVIDILRPNAGLKVDVLGTFDGADRPAEREVHVRYCDTSFAEKELGYSPKITLDEGIKRIAAYGKMHADWPSV